MIWTNKYNLPERVINVITRGRKEKRPDINRLSITDLIEEPLPRILYINHWDDIVRDYSDMLTAVQGIALHERYEACATDDDDTEHKFEDIVSVDNQGIVVVGKADNYSEQTIIDVKQTGVYGPRYKLDKWEKQLNCYAWQRRKRGFDVDELLVDVWYRDWKLSNITWKDYPSIPYETIELPLWSFEEQGDYIKRQVQTHLWYTIQDKIENYGIPCSNKTRGIRYEAYKKGNKTPTKVESEKEDLEKWAEKQKFGVEIRKSEPVFCINYCKSRSICPFNPEKGE